MPAKGKLTERQYGEDEGKAIDAEAAARGLSAKDARSLLGECTFDVYLNGTAYWSNLPANVWGYYIGGYQVIKKWLRMIVPVESFAALSRIVSSSSVSSVESRLLVEADLVGVAGFAAPRGNSRFTVESRCWRNRTSKSDRSSYSSIRPFFLHSALKF